MRYVILTLMLLPLLASAVDAAAEKEIKGQIMHVTLFPDRAQVNSEAMVNIQPGETVLTLRGLSPYIIRSTIQVSGEGGFTIMGVSHSVDYLSSSDDSPEVAGLRESIKSVTVKLEDEKNAVEILKEKEAFLSANKVVAGKDGSISVEQYKALLELYSSNIEQIRNGILKKNRLIKEYEKQLQDLNNQLSQIAARKSLPSGVISVAVSSLKSVSGKLAISYVVTNAGWTPSYDIRVDDINKPVTLVYMANVFQSTGNDWKGVKLSFTNATPSQSGIVPTLPAWYLNFTQPVVPSSQVRLAAALPWSKAMAGEELAYAAGGDAVAPEVTISRGATTVSFDVTLPADVPSDGRQKAIEIGRATTPATFAWECVPKLSPEAYLTGSIGRWEELNIIGGEANLYFESTFVGQSIISPAQFGDSMKISLGSDKGITIKRERQSEITSKKLIGANRIDTRSFRISVRNNKKDPVILRITDQIPISSNSEIIVNATELSGGNLNSVTGQVVWELQLASQQSRDLILTYTVKYPKDKEIILE